MVLTLVVTFGSVLSFCLDFAFIRSELASLNNATGGGIQSNLWSRRWGPAGVRARRRRLWMKLKWRSTCRVSGPLTPGGYVSYQTRRYRLLDILDHTTRRGHNTQLLKWEGDCIECGAKFTFETNKSKFSPLARWKPRR